MTTVLPIFANAGTVSVSVIDNAGNPVNNAIVEIMTKQPGSAKNALSNAVNINQVKMKFDPYLTILPVGGKITFSNNDPWEHHIRGSAAGISQFMAGDSGGFDRVLDGKAANKPANTADVTLSKAGVVRLGCHLHSNMLAYAYVTDSPWTQQTTTTGKVVFDDVPDGPAQVKVWFAEQLFDLPLQSVTVSDKASAVSVKLNLIPKRK